MDHISGKEAHSCDDDVEEFLSNWPYGPLAFDFNDVRQFAETLNVPLTNFLARELNRAAEGYGYDKTAISRHKALPSPRKRQENFQSIAKTAKKLTRQISKLHEPDRWLLAACSGDDELPPLGDLPQRLADDLETMANFSETAAQRIETGKRGDKPDLALGLWVPILCIAYQNITGEKATVYFHDESETFEGRFLDWVYRFLNHVDPNLLVEKTRLALGRNIQNFFKKNPYLQKRP